MFRSYERFERHEHNFNVIFATFVATLSSLIVGGALALLHFFTNGLTWTVFVALVALPIIVYIATAHDSEFKIAYYKTWRDRFRGWQDQNKILQQFARKYNIPNWHTKLDKIAVDGRWKFSADTTYMHRLADRRDLLLNKINQDYANQLASINKSITEANRQVVDADISYQAARQEEADTKLLIEKAQSAAETYRERREHKAALRICQSRQEAVNDARHHLKQLEQDREHLNKNYQNVIYRVIKIYYARYTRYTETAIKKINKINGLKYAIIDMPEPAAWVKGSAKKEIK